MHFNQCASVEYKLIICYNVKLNMRKRYNIPTTLILTRHQIICFRKIVVIIIKYSRGKLWQVNIVCPLQFWPSDAVRKRIKSIASTLYVKDNNLYVPTKFVDITTDVPYIARVGYNHDRGSVTIDFCPGLKLVWFSIRENIMSFGWTYHYALRDRCCKQT